MKKILVYIIALVMFIMPISLNALSVNYKDEVSEITGATVEEGKANLYLFHGRDCPHCKAEIKWLQSIEQKYKDKLNIVYYEVWYDETNAEYMQEVKNKFGIKETGVPFTVIGEKTFVGYSDIVSEFISEAISEYVPEIDADGNVKLPLFGTFNVKNSSITLVAVVLGLIDGFNPCAMWVLLFLIGMLFKMNNKRRAWILGISFLFMSAFIYFMSMLGINVVLRVATIDWIKKGIAIFILVTGALNLYKYFKMRKKETGCEVVNETRRKKLITRIRNIIDSKSFILALIGICVLGISVNLVELACSLGFPVVFNELLAINNITGVARIFYLLLYILFYMIDDLAVFIISMITLEATGITNKYNKLCTLVSAIIMIAMGTLLIVKPEWLMLNF